MPTKSLPQASGHSPHKVRGFRYPCARVLPGPRTRGLRSSGTTLVTMRGLGEAAYWQSGADLLHVRVRGVYVMLDVNAVTHIPPGPGERIQQRAAAGKRTTGIALVRDTILPRLADSRFLSTGKPPPNGHGDHSS